MCQARSGDGGSVGAGREEQSEHETTEIKTKGYIQTYLGLADAHIWREWISGSEWLFSSVICFGWFPSKSLRTNKDVRQPLSLLLFTRGLKCLIYWMNCSKKELHYFVKKNCAEGAGGIIDVCFFSLIPVHRNEGQWSLGRPLDWDFLRRSPAEVRRTAGFSFNVTSAKQIKDSWCTQPAAGKKWLSEW